MRKSRAIAASAVLAALAGVTACGSRPNESYDSRAEGIDMRGVSTTAASALDQVVAATTHMGTTALAQAPREENAVFSPVSLAFALAMLTEGARGTTLHDLERALGATGEERRDAFAALQQTLAEYEGDPADATADELPKRPIVHRANRLVVHDDFEVEADYLAALADGFGAGVDYTDLSSPDAKKVLSEWINHHTGGLIEESAIEPHDDLRVVLQDALLLAARWQVPLSPEGTYDAPFRVADGTEVQVETMGGYHEDFGYVSVDGWEAVRLPYTEALHADVLLPPAGTDPANATPELLAAIAAALNSAGDETVGLSIPVLDIEGGEFDLIGTGVFDALGIGSVLCSDTPDLSGIALDPGDLCVDQAVQQAVLKVDQDGTVAAAVTEIAARMVSGIVVERRVTFDRPFLFTVSHSDTALPLFLAAIRDPRP